MATPEGTPILLDPRARPIPQVWDDTATNRFDGSAGDWRATAPADLSGSAPLAAPSSNIPLTTIPYPSGPVAVLAGACTYGFSLVCDADSADRLYYGGAGMDATHGDVLEPGDRVWLPVSDSAAISVMAAAAGVLYRGIRW